MGASLAVQGTTTATVLEAYYVEKVLAPSLRPGQLVLMDKLVVMDNLLSAHKGARVRQLVEERGCELLYLPHPTLLRT